MKTRYRDTKTHLLAGALVFGLAQGVNAQDYNEQPTPEELAKLGLEGTELTPTGAIRAGNAEGTIPAWKNEPVQPPPGWQPGGWHADPFPNDKVLFTITSENYREHADKLSPGQQKLFETYPDYFMNIYPTDFSFRVDPDSYFTPAQVRRDGLR